MRLHVAGPCVSCGHYAERVDNAPGGMPDWYVSTFTLLCVPCRDRLDVAMRRRDLLEQLGALMLERVATLQTVAPQSPPAARWRRDNPGAPLSDFWR